MANPASADQALVPDGSEQQVAQLIALFHAKIALPFVPNDGAHGLVFGEWGHGKSQVLYRLARFMEGHRDRCLTLALIPESLAPHGVLAAAAGAARKLGLAHEPLRAAVERVRKLGTGPEAIRATANTLADWAAGVDKPHTALLFDEAQTLGGAEVYQSILREIRTAFDAHRIMLHTLQCHSMVSLDRARELGQALTWLQGPDVRHVFLASLDTDQTEELLRARVRTVISDPAVLDAFFANGWARTVCRLVGGSPRKTLLLAQTVADEMTRRGGSVPTGEDVIAAATREAGPTPGSRLFNPDRLRTICELLPQVWPSALGNAMVLQLKDNIARWFGESSAIDLAILASKANTSVAELQGVIRRPVAGIELFTVELDPIVETTMVSLSRQLWDFFGAPFVHGGGMDEKQGQFRLLLASAAMQNEIADALKVPITQAQEWRAFECLEPPVPMGLGVDSDGRYLRGYRALLQANGAPEAAPVLVVPMLGKTQWPEATRSAVEKRLHDHSVARVVLLDFLVDEENGAEPWPSEPVETSRIARIDYRQWGKSDADGGEDGSQSLAVKAARLGAALLGYAGSLAKNVEPSDSDTKAVGNLVEMIGSALPGADDFTYLPSALQRHILDLPVWAEGPLLTLKQMGEGVTGALVSPLATHYLVKEGVRWRRRPPLETPLAKLVHGTLQRARGTVSEAALAATARKTLLLAQHTELPACINWLADKFIEAGQVERQLDGLIYVNLETEIKDLGKKVVQSRRNVKDELLKLKIIRRERWLPLQRKLEPLLIDTDRKQISGRQLHDMLQATLGELRNLLGDVATELRLSESKITGFVTDARTTAKQWEERIAKVHVAWREGLQLEKAVEELIQSAEAVCNVRGGDDVDRYSAACDAYATFGARRDTLARLFDPPSDASARAKVAALGVGSPFRDVSVVYSETQS